LVLAHPKFEEEKEKKKRKKGTIQREGTGQFLTE